MILQLKFFTIFKSFLHWEPWQIAESADIHLLSISLFCVLWRVQRLPCALFLGGFKCRGVTGLNTDSYSEKRKVSALVNFQSSFGIVEVGTDSFGPRTLFIR